MLLYEKYVDKIIEKCDHIFISKTWKRSYNGIKELQIGFNILMASIKKLNKKFHEITGKAKLPRIIVREFKKVKVKKEDYEICRIAYDRRGKSGQEVFLVTNDHHFLQLQLVFERDGIHVESHCEELRRIGIKV